MDCDGIVLCPGSGKVAISVRLFISSCFEFALHWVYVLGALLSGMLSARASDLRPATLVFGVGQESLFDNGSDARFIEYCRKGPIAPLVKANRVIVQSVAPSESVLTSEFTYSRIPLATLIRRTHLGAAVRANLLIRHLTAPYILLLAAIRFPPLILLARDIAYAFAIKVLDRNDFIEAVVITNSAFTSQPLWMRDATDRKFAVHMVWYSQNVVPFVYIRDGHVSDVPNYRHVRADQMWVWTNGFKDYLEKVGISSSIHVVGPILWYMPTPPRAHSDTDIRIAIFDVTPVRDDVARRIGLIDNYYSMENMERFIEEAVSVCRELEAITGRRVRVLLKHKRNYNTSHDQRYIELIERITLSGTGVELVPFQSNMYSLVSECDASIVVPYSSPAFVASHLGRHSIYFDPTGELAPTFEKAALIGFAFDRAGLKRQLVEIMSSKTAYENGSVGVVDSLDPVMQGDGEKSAS